jgi:hypothetical protein
VSLTLPTNYSNALSKPFRENLLVRLYYDASNYTAIALYDHTVSSVAYTGCILNNPSFKEKINLKKATSSNGNVTLDCADATFGSDKLSALLINGSNTYLSRKVEIYSILNDSSDIADGIKIFVGRLQSVGMNDARVKLNIVAHRPWDFVNLPNTKSSNNVYVPIAYGYYTGNTTGGLTTSKTMYPAPFRSSAGDNSYFLTVNQSAETANACFYDKSAELFPHLTQDSSSAALSMYGDTKFAIGISRSITRTFRVRPTSFVAATDFTNTANVYDTDNATYANDSLTTSGTSSTRLRVTLPQISGKVTAATMYIKADVTLTHGTTSDSDAIVADDSFGASTSIITADANGETTATSGSADSAGSGSAYSSVSWTTAVGNNSNKLPDQVIIELLGVSGDSGSLTAAGKVYDIYFVITSTTDFGNEPNASAKEVQDLDFVYVGADGLPSNSSWSGDTNALTKVHEFHRDILHRYLGITATPGNWSALNSARSSWTGRYWVTESTSVKSILEKLQYEGGFIFLFSQETPKYVYIPNSITANHTLTKSDIANLQISHTGIGDLITKMEIGYEKHPAEDKYESSATYTSGERSDYDFATNENVAQVDLDSLVAAVSGGSNRNDSFEKYYDKITGTLKAIVSCDVVDPTISGLIEVGDFVQFTNGSMDTKPFGDAWTSKDFIITSVTRKVGVQVKIECREC